MREGTSRHLSFAPQVLLSTLGVLACLSFGGCGVSEDRKDDENASIYQCSLPSFRCYAPECCSSDSDCNRSEDPDRWSHFCSLSTSHPVSHCNTGRCEPKLRGCERDSECCPGQVCAKLAGEGICSDRFTFCNDDSSCPRKDQRCREIALSPAGHGCTFLPCEDGSCPDGLSCFENYCIGEAPCDGGCPDVDGKPAACILATNRCFALGEPGQSTDDPWKEPECAAGEYCSPGFFPSSCFQTCSEGTLLVFQDQQNIWNECSWLTEKLECKCSVLPEFAEESIE